jgi:hypothetical protein
LSAKKPTLRAYNPTRRDRDWATGINAMMIGLTILAVLTFIAIGEIRRTQGPQLTSED